MTLLERERQLEALDGWLREAAAGQGRFVLVGGEAGVGKTALVGRFCGMARGRMRVLLGACDALSTPRPLGPLLDIAAEAGGELDRLLSVDAPRDRIFRAALTELGAGLTPTLAVIEDAHWADEATIDLLRFLGRRLHAVRALLVVTYRDDEVGQRHPLRLLLGDLATTVSIRRLGVSPLSEASIQALAAGSGLDPISLHRLTGGNPFFATEVLAAEAAAGGIPATVHDAVLARAARLPPLARATLDAAAVIGSPIGPELLAEVAGATTEAIEACLAGGMLVAAGRAYAFRHELARVAIRDAISPPRRRALHEAVLSALCTASEANRDVTRLAHHAEAAGDEQAVLAYAPAAARRAASLRANREATAQYARALRFAEGLPDEQGLALWEAYAEVADLSGQGAAGIGPRREMIALARRAGDRPKEAEHLAWLALTQVLAGQNTDAELAVGAALAALDGVPEGPAHAHVYCHLAELRMTNRDLVEAVVWGERAIALAEQHGDDKTRILGLHALGEARLASGDVERGRANLELSLRLARAGGHEGLVVGALADLGSGHGESFLFAEADRYLTEAIAYATERDFLDTWHHWAVAWLALTRLFQGRWAAAADLAASVLRIPTASSLTTDHPATSDILTSFETPSYIRLPALLALGRVRARRGDPEVAANLDEALALSPATGMRQFLGPLHAARAEAAWLAGDRERTRAEVQAAFDVVVRQGLRWHIGELAYWLWRIGDLVVPPPDAAAPFALQIGGDWAAAAAEWRELGCPYEAARALAEGGDEMAVREALAEFERLGARPAAAMAARRLREMGARDIPRGPRPATRANPANLTTREVEILALIAAGRTNVEVATLLFLSTKTVEHHVTAILAKLGVRSRREAVRTAIDLGLLPQSEGLPTPT